MSPATTVYLSAFCGRVRLLQRGAIWSSAIFRRKLIPPGMCCLFTPTLQGFIQTTYVQRCAKKQSNLVHTWGIASPHRIKRGYANADSGRALLEWISREKNWARARKKRMWKTREAKLDKRKLSGKRFRNGIPLGILKGTAIESATDETGTECK